MSFSEFKCWYCKTDDDVMFFSHEFDCYVHKKCIKKAAKDKDDREAKIFVREFHLEDQI